jgi:hypothetical protein
MSREKGTGWFFDIKEGEKSSLPSFPSRLPEIDFVKLRNFPWEAVPLVIGNIDVESH